MSDRRSTFYVIACAMIAVIGIGVVRAPIVAIAGSALFVLAVAAYVNPWKAACALAFLTAAFPKAGAKVGDFPLPVFLLGMVVALLLLPSGAKTLRTPHSGSIVALLLFYLAWVGWRISVLLPTAAFGGALAAAAWMVGPVVYLLLATRIGTVPQGWLRALERGFLAAAAFGLVQLTVGIEQTKIPGLTIAFGDSYEDKHNVITSTTGVDFSKIMSTYQGGNTFGIAAAVFLVIAGQRIIKRYSTRHDWILFSAAAISIGISGSRTAILGAGAGVLALYLSSGSLKRKVTILGFAAAAGWATLLLLPGLSERYTVSNVINSGGSGRAEIWRHAFEATTTHDWFFGADVHMPLEGFPGIMFQLGLVGMAMAAVIIYSAAGLRRTGWMAPYVALGAACSVDYSYALFPTLFIPAAAAACSAYVVRERPKVEPRTRHQMSATGHWA